MGLLSNISVFLRPTRVQCRLPIGEEEPDSKAPDFALAKPFYLEMRNSLGSSNFSESGIGVGCQE